MNQETEQPKAFRLTIITDSNYNSESMYRIMTDAGFTHTKATADAIVYMIDYAYLASVKNLLSSAGFILNEDYLLS